MESELKAQANGAAVEKEYKELPKVEQPAQLLTDSLQKMVKLGGFKVFENAIKGTANLNPDTKARKKIFLTDDGKKEERKQLKQKLELWYNTLSSSDNITDVIASSQAQADSAGAAYKSNLRLAVEASKELEANYASLGLFYRNTGQDKVKNITILNAGMEDLKDLRTPLFQEAVRDELNDYYNRLQLKDNYSLLVIPGYLGNNQVVDSWSRVAYANKVMMLTDYENLESPDGVAEEFESANLTSADAHKANVMMAANWLVGRGKDAEIEEEEDLYVAPSSALAGKVYGTLMSQVTAGAKHGGLIDVSGVRFPLKKTEITSLEKMGLIPMVNEFGKVMPYSAKTLFNGDNIGMQTYSVVRVFDYIMKTLMDFLNRRAFENWNVNLKMELKGQLEKWLDDHTGPGNLIEKFKILRFDQDPNQKDRILLDFHITPYFPAKNFLISLDGMKGDDAAPSWGSEVKQA